MYDGNKIKTEFIKSSSDNLKMKVIFLDVDGVLNSDEYFDKIKNVNICGIESEIDVEKIKLLKKAVDETGANVVLSSSWRYTRNAQYLKELLLRYGINADSTPFIQNERGLEIKQWLLEHPEVEKFVILDDEIFDSYDEVLIKRLIKISNCNGYGYGEGLLSKDIDEIIERLGRKKEKIEKNNEFER
ncbi:MAG: hypothetical protein BHW00_03070 [Clostridium sp. 26_22]|nr:MAG: hypothetical protein BHW00_03070 [Clostridium sp. 26_22]